MMAKNILYSGNYQPVLKPLSLRAGPVTMIFEPATACLRYIRLGDHEVLRAIYAAVRDQNWATIQPVLSNLQSEIAPDSFRLTFDVACREREIDFSWRGFIEGDPNGRVAYKFDGEAISRFLRNRIGICILHPILECSGRPCVVKHFDGTEERGHFPRSISPHQPFFEIQSISHEVATTGITSEVVFSGEIFEMEDQRNWTDNSFKTYCTPQSLPKPGQVGPGTKVQQTVTLNLKGRVRPILPVLQGRPPQLAISTTPVLPLPPIGYCVARYGFPMSERETERLKRLGPSHLRVDLDLSSSAWPQVLEKVATEPKQVNTGLYLAVILGNGAEQDGLRAVARAVQRAQLKVLLWLIFHEGEQVTPEKWVRLAQSTLQTVQPNLLVAAVTREFFTELNRNRPSREAPFFLCYPSTPQVHMRDNTTMVENLAGQASTVETAREFSARPVVVSPITLRIRSAPNAAANVTTPGSSSDLPPDVDPRQMSLFGAGWTLGSIALCAATAN